SLLPDPTGGLVILKLSPNAMPAGTIKRLFHAWSIRHRDCDQLDAFLPGGRGETFELPPPVLIEMSGAQQRHRTIVDAGHGVVDGCRARVRPAENHRTVLIRTVTPKSRAC